MKISGYTLSHNLLSLDYCIRETLICLLGVCDEVVVCDSDSTDGTREMLDAMAQLYPKLRIINRSWEKPFKKWGWVSEWRNYTRGFLKHPMQLHVDADELVDPTGYDAIREHAANRACVWFHRINFWQDAHHVVPHGNVCGHAVVRLAPAELPMYSDEMFPYGEPEIRVRAGWPPEKYWDTRCRLLHYGFLRKDHCILPKQKILRDGHFGEHEKWIDELEAQGRTDYRSAWTFDYPLLPFSGKHPDVIVPWLQDRNRL